MNSYSNFVNLKIEQIKAYLHEFRNAWFNLKSTSTSEMHLVLEKHLWIRIVLINNCVKNLLKTNYVKFCIHTEKDNLCFYKNSTNQILTFISNKVVYFKSISHIKHSNHRKRNALPLTCHLQAVKLAVGAIAEPLHPWLKVICRNLLFVLIWKDS